MERGKKLTGFPEWLPQQELVQQRIIASLRQCFELHGFTPLHLRSVERVSNLATQGETSKEIYGVRRLASEGKDSDDDDALGLRYDLTLPFARFVVENEGQLNFPFRRFQIQTAWRGERPQLGRFREFIQADADLIHNKPLGARHDAEMIGLLLRALATLSLPPVKLYLNNRKVLQGFYLGLGITEVQKTLRIVDKLPKIAEKGVTAALGELGLSAEQIEKTLQIAKIETSSADELKRAVAALGVEHAELREGVAELALVLDACAGESPDIEVVAALHIARGFDYYTGTVAEGMLRDHPKLGAICSGGRYDRLAEGTQSAMPGMGVSVGVTRIMAFLDHLKLLSETRRTPARVLVIAHDEDSRALSDAAAKQLRARGIPCLVSENAVAYGKQFRQAEQLGIKFAWFPGKNGESDTVKNLETGAQEPASLESWTLPA
jgi:histidyl-tRNA synthetase